MSIIVNGAKGFTTDKFKEMVKEQINENTAPLADRATSDGSGNNIEETYAPLQSPSLVGTPTAPTASSNTNTDQIATTAFVQNAVANVVNSAPETLNTLDELANALGDDPNFATTVANNIGKKLDSSEVVTTATPNKVLRLDANGKLDADITGNADTATKAVQDGQGNVITDTYLTKSSASDTYLTKDDASSTYESITKANALVKSVTNNEGQITVKTQGGTTNSFYTGLNLLQRNKTYAVGDIAYSPNLPSWAYLECIQAGTTGAAEPDLQSSGGGGGLTSDGSVQWRIRDVRCRYQVGDIVPKLVSPKDYEYLLLCDGSSFDTSQYSLLAEVLPDGRLPDLRERLLEGSASAKQYREAGLPNITGDFFANDSNSLFWTGTKGANGAFNLLGTNMNVANPPVVSNITTTYAVQFNASRSNPIYGKSSTVQPASYTVTYYICYGG